MFFAMFKSEHISSEEYPALIKLHNLTSLGVKLGCVFKSKVVNSLFKSSISIWLIQCHYTHSIYHHLHMKYFYDLGIAKPTDVPRALFNQVMFGESFL